MSGVNKKPSSRTYGGLSNEERKAERRERFLEAGLELFGTVGIRGAKVRALCKEAGLTERYFYESFEDTDALFIEVYKQQVQSIQEYFVNELQNMPGEDLETRTRYCLRLYFEIMRDERLVRALYVESAAGSEKVVAMHRENTQLQVSWAAMLIKSDNAALAKLPDDIASGAAMAINGAIINMTVQWMLGGYSLAISTLVDCCYLVVMGTMQELHKLADNQA